MMYLSLRQVVLNQVQLLPGDICQYLEISLVITAGEWCHWPLVGRERGCCSTSYDTRPGFSAQNVSCVEVEKHWFTWVPLCMNTAEQLKEHVVGFSNVTALEFPGVPL